MALRLRARLMAAARSCSVARRGQTFRFAGLRILKVTLSIASILLRLRGWRDVKIAILIFMCRIAGDEQVPGKSGSVLFRITKVAEKECRVRFNECRAALPPG